MATDIATNKKLGELMLFIAQKNASSTRFGSIKLNKALFYSDFLWHFRTGKSITGISYQKMDYGPAPAGLLPVQEQLVRDDAAEIENRKVFPVGTEKRLIAKRDPDLSLFTPEEIAFVSDVIAWLGPDSTAKDVSEVTHQHLGWILAEYRETIPYSTIFLNDDIAAPSDVVRGLELAEERGWFKSTHTVA